MDRVVVVGNCQAKALEMMLATNEEFAKRFEFVSFPAVHEIPGEIVPRVAPARSPMLLWLFFSAFEDRLPRWDRSRHRDARDHCGYRPPLCAGRACIGPATSRISFICAMQREQPVVDGPFDYHDRTILGGVCRRY